MLESIRRGQRWLTGIFVAVIGLVFAAFIGLGGPLTPGGTTAAVVEVDGRHYGVLDYERLREIQEQRYRDALGDQFDSRTARDFLDSQALRQLVDGAILVYAAEELGYRVSDDEIKRAIRDLPGFRDADGRFDKDRFVEAIEYQHGSVRTFRRILSDDLLKQKLARLLHGQAHVSEGEAEAAARYHLEAVKIAYVALSTNELPPGVEVSDEDAEAYLADNETALRAAYEERAGEFQVPEKMRVRHILIRVDREAPQEEVEAARTRAEAARTRILEGASFADVAMELSEDPGSQEAGGDLGFVARTDVNEELADAAFSRPVGDVGEIVLSDSGFHVLVTEETAEAGVQSFEEVALELARERAGTARAAERATGLAETLAQAVRDGSSLEDAARAEELTLERTDALRRRPDGFVQGLGPSVELLASAFSLRPEAPSSPRTFEVENKLVLIQLLERVEPDPTELETRADELRQQLLEGQRNRLIQDWVDAERASLSDRGLLLVDADKVLTR